MFRVERNNGTYKFFPKTPGDQRSFRVNVSLDRKFDNELLIRLGQHAASRGVYKVNIVDAAVPLKYVRVTCQSMTIPVEVLDYVLKENLPFRSSLEQPEFLLPDYDARIEGDGYIIALKGVAVGPQVYFYTKRGSPIIIRENSTLNGPLDVYPGTVIPPDTFLGPQK